MIAESRRETDQYQNCRLAKRGQQRKQKMRVSAAYHQYCRAESGEIKPNSRPQPEN
jgi:hypothetical protein